MNCMLKFLRLFVNAVTRGQPKLADSLKLPHKVVQICVVGIGVDLFLNRLLRCNMEIPDSNSSFQNSGAELFLNVTAFIHAFLHLAGVNVPVRNSLFKAGSKVFIAERFQPYKPFSRLSLYGNVLSTLDFVTTLFQLVQQIVNAL